VSVPKPQNYLNITTILYKPNIHQPLLVYITTTDHTVNAALVQDVDDTQHPVYFIGRTLQDPETRYQMVEKLALSLVHAARHLRPYFQNHNIIVKTDYPIQNTPKVRPCWLHVVLGRRNIRVQHPLRTPRPHQNSMPPRLRQRPATHPRRRPIDTMLMVLRIRRGQGPILSLKAPTTSSSKNPSISPSRPPTIKPNMKPSSSAYPSPAKLALQNTHVQKRF